MTKKRVFEIVGNTLAMLGLAFALAYLFVIALSTVN